VRLHQPVDILAFGAHPDDVECGCGGLLAKEKSLGYRVAVIDLTRGELSTNGTVEIRKAEAGKAAQILGLSWRCNLELPDCGVGKGTGQLEKIVRVIRTAAPRVVLAPYVRDRHPDHEAACRLVTEACFAAGVGKLFPGLAPHRPAALLYYFLATSVTPQFIVDVTSVYEIKIRCIAVHQSQFSPEEGTATFLNTGQGSFPALVEARDRYYGSLIGTAYGEGFITEGPLPVADPVSLWAGL